MEPTDEVHILPREKPFSIQHLLLLAYKRATRLFLLLTWLSCDNDGDRG
jgi:hypothetical protein